MPTERQTTIIEILDDLGIHYALCDSVGIYISKLPCSSGYDPSVQYLIGTAGQETWSVFRYHFQFGPSNPAIISTDNVFELQEWLINEYDQA